MSLLAWVAALLVAAAALACAIVLVRFNLKRRYVARCAAAASPDRLERIYALVEATGTARSIGFVLARTNRTTNQSRSLMPIPQELPGFPWAGKVIEVTVSKEVEFRFVDASATVPTLLGRVYRPVRVPRHQMKHSAKERNTFAPERYIARSQELHAVLVATCPKHPAELLAFLLCIGRESFEFEPIDQARIGTSAAWVQDAANRSCPECRKRMHLILQLPGTMLREKSTQRGTYYLFGCVTHPHQTASLGQFT